MDDLLAFVRAQLDEDERVATAEAAHIIRFDPARALAEVEAKRQILDWCERAARIVDEAEVWSIDVSDIVEVMAQPYAGRPGWRDEWRLTG